MALNWHGSMAMAAMKKKHQREKQSK